MAIKLYKRQVNKKKGDAQQVHYSDKQKFEAVVSYLVTGNMAAVSDITGIPHDTLRHWKMAPWWKEMESQARQQKRIEVSGKLTKVIDKAFKEVEDRLENGDWVYNQKTGEVRRVAVNARTAGDILTKSIDRQIILDKIQEVPETKQEAVLDRLESIAKRLQEASGTKKLPPVVIEGEVIEGN